MAALAAMAKEKSALMQQRQSAPTGPAGISVQQQQVNVGPGGMRPDGGDTMSFVDGGAPAATGVAGGYAGAGGFSTQQQQQQQPLAAQFGDMTLVQSQTLGGTAAMSMTRGRSPSPVRGGTLRVEVDQQAGVVFTNRGALREGLQASAAHAENARLRYWEQFTLRQQRRHVPIPPDPSRRVLPRTAGYRLRIATLNNVPMAALPVPPAAAAGGAINFDLKLSVSLYDEALGTFYGCTCYSLPSNADLRGALQQGVASLQFNFDVYFHSRVSDPRCMAVVEVISAVKNADGVCVQEFSVGWAQLPLAGGAGQAVTAPVMAGTPRYLLLRNARGEDLRPPVVLDACSVTYGAELYEAADAYIPLLPEDCPVTYSDVVPGLRRFDAATGQPTSSTKAVISTLANPSLAPTVSVALSRLTVALPRQLHDLLASLVGTDMSGPALAAATQHATAGGGKAFLYTVRAAVHNGRTFVGPTADLLNITLITSVPGWMMLEVQPPDATFDWAMADPLTTIVVEVFAKPPPGAPAASDPILVGWAAFCPFADVSPDGSAARVAAGTHK